MHRSLPTTNPFFFNASANIEQRCHSHYVDSLLFGSVVRMKSRGTQLSITVPPALDLCATSLPVFLFRRGSEML